MDDLNEIEECEHKQPHKIDKVPVETYLLDHLVAAAPVIRSRYRSEIHQEVQTHPTEYVEAVEACDEEKEVGKILRTILVHMKVCSRNFYALPDSRCVIKYLLERWGIGSNNEVCPLPCLA